MKKRLIVLTAACLLLLTGCKKKSPPPEAPSGGGGVVQVQPASVQPVLPPAEQLGEKVTFEMSYRGSSGKSDDVRAYSFYGFGTVNENEQKKSAFITAVHEKAEHSLAVFRIHHHRKASYFAVEYKDRRALVCYVDLDADDKLSEAECLKPLSDEEGHSGGGDRFITSDFVATRDDGKKVPFRTLIQVDFYGDQNDMNQPPQAMMSAMGMYEGVAELNGQPMRLYLFGDMGNQNYIEYGRSNCSLIGADHDKSEWFNRNSLSSIITHDGAFYRLAVDGSDEEGGALKVHLYEDKTPRGKLAIKIDGSSECKHRLSSATLQGAGDRTIYFNIAEGMEELPVGEYRISRGTFYYGVESDDEYYTSFRDIPAFTVTAGNNAEVELGKPKVTIQAVEYDKRYHGDKEYKTEFPEGETIQVDAIFTGTAGETYSNFMQMVKTGNSTRRQDIKASYSLVDDKGNTVISKEMEYS
ncbi:MAG: hypothetical protein ACYSUT_08150 [Planctomycetota bacterium]|jgi:hypothetical protein